MLIHQAKAQRQGRRMAQSILAQTGKHSLTAPKYSVTILSGRPELSCPASRFGRMALLYGKSSNAFCFM